MDNVGISPAITIDIREIDRSEGAIVTEPEMANPIIDESAVEENNLEPRFPSSEIIDNADENNECGGLEMPDVHVLLDMKDNTIHRLQNDLRLAQLELKSKDEKCGRLEEMQGKVDSEIHELTASLFQEAYRMVQEANEKRVTSQKLLNEANGKIDVLQAEVEALKVLVITSTPSAPNKHLFPHLSSRNEHTSKQLRSTEKDKRNQISSSGHKRNYSDSASSMSGSTTTNSDDEPILERSFSHSHPSDYREIDPVYHKEFVSWREKLDPTDKVHPFLRRIYKEDILPCLDFANSELIKLVLEAIENNTVIIEKVVNDESTHATNCALSDVPRVCNYRLKLENHGGCPDDVDGLSKNGDEWLFISTLCRNRIAAVCNFLTYLRYLNQGLVKCGVNDAYWEIIRLRRCMALARLGYDFESV